MRVAVSLVLGALAAVAVVPAVAQQANNMTFFVTSVGPGKGGDLGGLDGADQYCASLAQAAGSTGKTWRADLSTQAAGGKPAVNARDRIGKGPWVNAKGVQIASDVENLHSSNMINRDTALDEHGMMVNGRVDTPNKHDMLTGSKQDGTLASDTEDVTCSNWTSSADGQGSAVVGHHDLIGNTRGVNFWNYSHKTPGCAPQNLQRVGGAGLFYCFAAN